MARVYVFADESGNFDFSLKQGASKYFLLGTLVLDPQAGEALLRLRRDLAWAGVGLDSTFHASEDEQAVRDAVFKMLQGTAFRFDVTLLEKRKTRPDLQKDPERFYKLAWYLHFKYVCPRIVSKNDELMVIAASLWTKRRRRALRAAVADVVGQSSNCKAWKVAWWPSESDPCLQVADYCAWAVQRKHELGDERSYALIRDKIHTEFQVFETGGTYFY